MTVAKVRGKGNQVIYQGGIVSLLKLVFAIVLGLPVLAEAQYIPRGNLDVANGNQIKGWAFDRDSGGVPAGSNPINVRFVFIGATNFVKDRRANLSRPDLAAWSEVGSAYHGFDFNPRLTYTDIPDGTYTLRAYAIDAVNVSYQKELTGSPVTITLTSTSLRFQGKKMDINGNPFSLDDSRIQVFGNGPKCSSSSSFTSTTPITCASSVTTFYGNAEVVDGAAKLQLNKPTGYRILASVVSGVSGFSSTDHPSSSYCLVQSSSLYLRTGFYAFPTFELFLKYIPEAKAPDYVPCDTGGSKRAYVAMATTASAGNGDIDGNGDVTVTDGVLALRCAAGLTSASGVTTNCAAGDVDGSGGVTVTDGVIILRRAAGLTDSGGSPPPSSINARYNPCPSINAGTTCETQISFISLNRKLCLQSIDLSSPICGTEGKVQVTLGSDKPSHEFTLTETASKSSAVLSRMTVLTPHYNASLVATSENPCVMYGQSSCNVNVSWTSDDPEACLYAEHGTVPLLCGVNGTYQMPVTWYEENVELHLTAKRDPNSRRLRTLFLTKVTSPHQQYPTLIPTTANPCTVQSGKSSCSVGIQWNGFGANVCLFDSSSNNALRCSAGESVNAYVDVNRPVTLYIRESSDPNSKQYASVNISAYQPTCGPDVVVGQWRNQFWHTCKPVGTGGTLLTAAADDYSQTNVTITKFETLVTFTSSTIKLAATYAGSLEFNIYEDGNPRLLAKYGCAGCSFDNQEVSLNVPTSKQVYISVVNEGYKSKPLVLYGNSLSAGGIPSTGGGGGGGGGTGGGANSWGGLGIGNSPVYAPVEVSLFLERQSNGLPYAIPEIYLDGKVPTRKPGYDLGLFDNVPTGSHIVSVKELPGFYSKISVAYGSFKHPPGTFRPGSSASINYDGAKFVHVQVIYLRNTSIFGATSMNLLSSGKVTSKVIEIGKKSDAVPLEEKMKERPFDIITFFKSLLQEVGFFNLFSKAEASERLGFKWAFCEAKGLNIHPKVWQYYSAGISPTLTEQINEAQSQWNSAAWGIANASQNTFEDFAPGSFDGNSLVAIVPEDYGFEDLLSLNSDKLTSFANESTATEIVLAKTLLYWVAGEQLPLDAYYRNYAVIRETDILIREGWYSPVPYGQKAWFRNLYMHEFGHALGVAHSTDSNIMSGSGLNTGEGGSMTWRNISLNTDDRNGVSDLYGECSAY